MATVKAEGLSKTYVVHPQAPGLLGALRGLLPSKGREVEAVGGLTFTIERGSFVGFVGPNGAGKSTTLKMLTGILAPTAGALEVCGVVPHRDRVALASRIGVVFGQRTQLWWDLSPGEGFDLLGRIYRVPPVDFRSRREELVERLDLGPLLDVPVRKLSLGQKMRCELAAALLHAPELLLLDEPTIGLDVVVRDALHAFLRTLSAERGTTVLLTSHDLDDIERLCHRVMVIDRGRILHDGDLTSLRTRYGHRRRVELHLREVPDGPLPVPDAATVVEQQDRRVVIELDAERLAVPELLRRLLADHDVLDVTVQEARIEDTIKRMVGGD
ncbi:MAG: ABC transporter ATP-binding protein [Alphaproteobacteria bacterium]|nr:ABC transporter ATP-binding protein [Alphaproteobacteria bacterium]MCB9698101.1 ABC transporter ATP-binding protein [Alphaproteobacteria bacterium]